MAHHIIVRNPEVTRTCTRCKQTLPISIFPTHKDRRARCRPCWREIRRDKYIKTNTPEERSKMAAFNREWHHRNLENGKCRVCSQARMEYGQYCETHYIQQAARLNIGKCSLEDVEILKKKFEDQGRKCFYTGEPITLGMNSSMDHILPISKFPEQRRNLQNVVWTTRNFNWFKRDFTMDELLFLCQSVINYFNR